MAQIETKVGKKEITKMFKKSNKKLEPKTTAVKISTNSAAEKTQNEVWVYT